MVRKRTVLNGCTGFSLLFAADGATDGRPRFRWHHHETGTARCLVKYYSGKLWQFRHGWLMEINGPVALCAAALDDGCAWDSNDVRCVSQSP